MSVTSEHGVINVQPHPRLLGVLGGVQLCVVAPPRRTRRQRAYDATPREPTHSMCRGGPAQDGHAQTGEAGNQPGYW